MTTAKCEILKSAAGKTVNPRTDGPTRAVSPFHPSAVLFVITALFAVKALAQSYSVDWFTIDGGGGTSTGGVYAVSGTLGQPDAGATMSGGNYSLTGGFWSLLSVVQTPGAPRLSITLTTTNTAMVWWPSPSTGFTLQQNTNGLGTVNWSNVVTSPTDNGTIKYVIVNPPTGHRFYRLHKP
jgi:hypothetical protein